MRPAAGVAVLLLACAPPGARGDERPGLFRITPPRPVAELRVEALAASPPQEDGPFRPVDLVELTSLDPTLRLDIRYATADNFLSTPVYEEARAFLQRPAAEALVRAHRSLAAKGYGLLIHDAYRPWWVTKLFWDATPKDKRDFVADPAKGSRHNRACAVDLTLYRLSDGRAVEMPSLYDEMSERSRPGYGGGTPEQRAAPRPPALRHGEGGLHGLRVGVVALRLPGLARVPDPERAFRADREQSSPRRRSALRATMDRPRVCERGDDPTAHVRAPAIRQRTSARARARRRRRRSRSASRIPRASTDTQRPCSSVKK